MPSLRVHAMTRSLDGYVAGPRQRLEEPSGDGGSQLHQWMFATRTMRERLGQAGGNEGPDDRAVLDGEVNIGATIMGRNMFPAARTVGRRILDRLVGRDSALSARRLRDDPSPASNAEDGRRHHVPLSRRAAREGPKPRLRRDLSSYAASAPVSTGLATHVRLTRTH